MDEYIDKKKNISQSYCNLPSIPDVPLVGFPLFPFLDSSKTMSLAKISNE